MGKSAGYLTISNFCFLHKMPGLVERWKDADISICQYFVYLFCEEKENQ